MMQHWSDYLDLLRSGDGDKSSANGKVVAVNFGSRSKRSLQ